MRRPSSPAPRRSQDTRPNTPPPVASGQLRRSSSDVSSRPGRFLAKLKNAGGSSSNSSSNNANNASTSGSTSALAFPASSSATSLGSGVKASTSPKSSTLHSARDMHRGATLPTSGSLSPNMINPSNASTLSLASTLTNTTISPSTSTTDPWSILHVHVLPLFNGEQLRMPIEELNHYVKKHITTVVARSPSRALATLEQDITALLKRGMVTMCVKLRDLDDQVLLPRLSQTWELFWHGVLPYLEGVFLPLRTEKPIQSLARTPKSNRPSSPTQEETATSTQSIDVRLVALRTFRDALLLPLFSRLEALIGSPKAPSPSSSQSLYPRLQQMLLVLVSIAQPSHSSSEKPSQAEAAVVHLLRAVRSPRTAIPSRAFNLVRHTSFFAGAAPRDRRGRVARKSLNVKGLNLRREPSVEWDEETPRNGVGIIGLGDDRERQKEFLDSLKSPDVGIEEEDEEEDEKQLVDAGGWGLGRGQDHYGEEDEEEDTLNEWNQAQDVVERMVGLRN
ncbi:hypothetical protein M422DRAFT_27698 [Sphaerobolus stellatus SS14]|nr:hypothetical protein M422DRAFT_27698 [Sphaerobolus stellatus SS14]